jgi:hypothetical protein
MPTRRTILNSPALSLLSGDPEASSRKLDLVSDYTACSQRTAAVYARRDEAESAMGKCGAKRCVLVEACDQELIPLWHDMNAIIRRAVTEPARDLQEFAAKMMVWRAETVLLGHRLESERDVAAFGVYSDLLRLAGLMHLAHPLDARTRAKACLWDGE